jgi:hypothetical protein
MIFGIIHVAIEYLKIILCAMENLIAPLDGARRVVLGTLIGTVGTGS